MSLSGKHVVVIGGSSGMGLEVARLASQAGARVTIMARNKEKLERAAAELKVEYKTIDMSDPESIKNTIGTLTKIDHVYNGSGSTAPGSIYEENLDHFLNAFETRVYGNIHLFRALRNKVASDGSIVLTGGLSSDRPIKGVWVSNLGTLATEQFVRSMALDLAPLRVNAISPGWTDTPMWDAILGENKQAVFADAASKTPLNKICSAEDVARGIIFLMENKSITGEVLHVDAGARLT